MAVRDLPSLGLPAQTQAHSVQDAETRDDGMISNPATRLGPEPLTGARIMTDHQWMLGRPQEPSTSKPGPDLTRLGAKVWHTQKARIS